MNQHSQARSPHAGYTLPINVEEALYAVLKTHADKVGLTVNELIIGILRAYKAQSVNQILEGLTLPELVAMLQ